jgi:hypothetical protein
LQEGEERSFSEEKEPKRLYPGFLGAAVPKALPHQAKVFWFFFVKKNLFLLLIRGADCGFSFVNT